VLGVGAVSMLPLSGGNLCNEATVGGQAVDSLQCVESRSISPGYFSALGIRLLKGRTFTERDNATAPRVAVINRTMALLLGSVDGAIGKQFGFRDEVREVVGVVEDIKHLSLDTEVQPAAYLPVVQHPMSFSAFVVRASADPIGLSHSVQAEIWSIDKDLPVASLKTMDEVLSASIAQPRLRMLLVGGFAALALFLAVLGLYSVVAYGVSQRTHEIGLRVALGAQPRDVVRLVVGQGLRLALIGIGVGLIGAMAATRVLAAMLFGVGTTDPVTFFAVALLTVAVTLAASYLPARKAMSIDPMVALRYE
jgi:putative ABC transport system permease protein